MGSFFPLKNIVSLSTGQGVSGILMALLGLIVRYVVNTDNEEKDLKNGALIFFGVSLLLTILIFFSLLYLYKSKYGTYHLSKENNEENNKKEIKEEHDKDIIKDHERIESKDSDNKLVQIVHYTHKKNEEHHPINENDKNKQKIKNKEKVSQEISFIDLFKLLKEVNILIFYNYIIAYGLYPYACKAQALFHTGEYRVNIIILLYSCSNTIGRYLMKFFKPTKKLTYIPYNLYLS